MYNKAESEEVAPEMRAAIHRACALLGVEAPVKDLDRDASLRDECLVELGRASCARAWPRRFC